MVENPRNSLDNVMKNTSNFSNFFYIFVLNYSFIMTITDFQEIWLGKAYLIFFTEYADWDTDVI